MEYHDLGRLRERERFSHVVEMAREKGLYHPLVALNGEIVLAGGAEYYQLLPFVEEALNKGEPESPG